MTYDDLTPSLEQMIDRMVDKYFDRRPSYNDYVPCVGGWIKVRAKAHFKERLRREDSSKWDAELLCEIAVLNSIIEWCEERDNRPLRISIPDL